MASKQKKGAKGSKKGKAGRRESGSSVIDAATGFLDVVEQTGDALAREVKQQFDHLAERVSTLASAAGETTAAVAEKVSKEPVDTLRGLLQDVKEVGETSVRTISEGFDTLRQHFVGVTEETGAEQDKTKPSPRKKTAKKDKAPTAKDKASDNKTAPKKKAATKKTAPKKKAATKKAATKKTVTKVDSKNTTTAKKAGRQKTRSKKPPAA